MPLLIQKLPACIDKCVKLLQLTGDRPKRMNRIEIDWERIER